MNAVMGTPATPLAELGYDELCPGGDALAELQQRFR